MKIKPRGNNRGAILLLLLFLVFVVVMGVLFIGAYRACKRLENIEQERQKAINEACREAEVFGSNYCQQVGGETYVIQMNYEEGYGIITSSTNLTDWETNGTVDSIAAAHEWQQNFSTLTTPPTTGNRFYRVLVVVTNQ